MIHFFDKTRRDGRGAALLVTVIIISAGIVSIVIGAGFNAMSENFIIMHQDISQKTFFHADSCAEEAMIRLNRNNVYVGETFNIDNTVCTVTASGSGVVRTLRVSAERNEYEKIIEVSVRLFPQFTLLSWKEKNL